MILLCSVSPEGEETRSETVGRPWHVWSTWFVRHIHVKDNKLITFYGGASTIYNHTTHTHTEKIHAIIYSRWWVRNWSKCQSKRRSYSCKVIEFMYTCAGLVPRFPIPPQSVQNRNKGSVGRVGGLEVGGRRRWKVTEPAADVDRWLDPSAYWRMRTPSCVFLALSIGICLSGTGEGECAFFSIFRHKIYRLFLVNNYFTALAQVHEHIYYQIFSGIGLCLSFNHKTKTNYFCATSELKINSEKEISISGIILVSNAI